MNTVRFAVFRIFFTVIGYSLAMSGLLNKSTSAIDSPEPPPESVTIEMIPETIIEQEELECSEGIGECFETKVVRIIDGDTLESLHDERIRFSLSSAPKLNEAGGPEARRPSAGRDRHAMHRRRAGSSASPAAAFR